VTALDQDKSSKLVVHTESGGRYDYLLEKTPVTIGRDNDCDLVLDDLFVSRHHARVDQKGGGHIIADDNSRNGTIVGGNKIRGPQRLEYGDEIQIGNTKLIYVATSANKATTAILLPPGEAASPARVRVDEPNWDVFIDGQRLPVRLSPLEFKFLAYLAAHSSAICSRNELGRAIWGEGAYTYDMLHQLVHRVKQRLREGAADPLILVAVPGVGYKLDSGGEHVRKQSIRRM
jgi:pSer/pThr/pTyr-binding forkhead associated (FHA) protein